MRRPIAGALLVLALWTSSASAHTGGAVLRVDTSDAKEGLAVDVTVAVNYEGDGEPAERAFVAVTPRAEDGRRLAKQDLERADGGRYTGTIAVDEPGRWTLEVTSSFPPGEATTVVDIGRGSMNRTPIIAGALVAGAVLAAAVSWRRWRRRSARH